MSGSRTPRIVCLLPVRNAAESLTEWLDEAARFADAVVALDDGSTDASGALLEAHPLVATVLTNERRAGHLGWHDGRNRNRLLTAAADLGPDWILSLDADERLDPTDAEALRQFVVTEALPGCAYGFEVYRMVDADTYDPGCEWAFRLFSFKPGQRFINRRLNLVPVPAAIGPERWIPTTLRIKHFGDADEASRARRLAKYRDADPEGNFRDYYENLPPHSPGPFARWRPREPDTAVLRAPTTDADQVSRPHVVCLLPARNCAYLLPGWFESISRVADAVVALDDGSTDDTGARLREHPLVVRLLTNPASEAGFSQWDDGENRNRLLAAAAELSPEWVISVDADERIPLEDAAALRRFLRHEAEPGHGYSLASYRMIGDEDHYDRLDYDAYRLFAFERGHVFPTDRLHAPPIPTAIPRSQWRQTTIRMKHLASLTSADRRARRAKFEQADPNHAWEPDYAYTVQRPGRRKVWEHRPLTLAPLVVYGAAADATAALDLDGPVLTVVISVEPNDEHDVPLMLDNLAAGQDPRFEFLAATRDGYAADVLGRDERVTVVPVQPEVTEAGLRNAALGASRGDYVTFLSVRDRVNCAGLEDLLDAHEGGHGLIRVRVAAADTTPAGVAALLLAGDQLDETYASFVREPLLSVGGFNDDGPDRLETAAARTLLDIGVTAATVPSVVRVDRARSSVVDLLRQRYAAGRRRPAGEAGGQPSGKPTAAWRQLGDLDGSVAAPRPTMAGLLAASAAATWLGSVRGRRRFRKPRD
jgi:glycosyltransferase involved in cell wall biosynthesis